MREAVLISGFGPGADWYLNALLGGVLELHNAGVRLHPEARALEPRGSGGGRWPITNAATD
ncbi:MAG: hypothetical protein WB507_02825 [Solirubrobacterales bacterium]